MKWSFRKRLLIGHILLILVLVPLLGFILIFLIETRLVIPTLANDMIDQGLLVARLAQGDSSIWTSPGQAQALLDSIPPRPPTRIGLLDPKGILLATNRPDDSDLVGQQITNLPSTKNVNDPAWAIEPNGRGGDRVLDVIVPVTYGGGMVSGSVRIYRRIADIEQIFTGLRLIILAVLVVGLVISSMTTFLLSNTFNHSLQRLTQTIANAPLEGDTPPLAEEGDEELRALTRAYNRLQERRLELEQTHEQLLANLIHEIGRPLGSLRTAIHALQTGAMEDAELRNDLLRGMTERIVRMGRLLQDLSLTYRKLTPQEMHVQITQVSDWLDQLTPLWAENAREHALEWHCFIEDGLPLIQADRERLAQALSNLVSNAMKFTPAGGKVSLKACRTDGEIVFIVEDNGAGISLEDQAHLFTPFYRGENVPSKAPGLGLGLSISQSIIESMGGKITLESCPRQGSAFTIHFPLQ
jgi:signal transduction histidine kinase